jgi:hypothetical protein
VQAALLAAAAAAGLEYTTVPPSAFLPDPIPTEYAGHIANMTIYRFTWRR